MKLFMKNIRLSIVYLLAIGSLLTSYSCTPESDTTPEDKNPKKDIISGTYEFRSENNSNNYKYINNNSIKYRDTIYNIDHTVFLVTWTFDSLGK